METSAESARPLALLQTIPSDVLELSSIWQLLHVELVQQILDHLIEDLLTCCKASEIYSTAENSAILEDVWFNFRHNDLFKSRKSLIERHFHDHWLSCVEVSIYIGGPGHSGFESCCRYTHASHGHKSLGVLLDPELTPSNDGNPELEKVVFCLAELNATRRADLVRMWDKVINAGGTECYPLHIAPPPNGDGHHRSFSSTARRLLEDWEILDDGDRIRFPWKKLMTMVLTYIMGLWRTDDKNESTVPLGTLELCNLAVIADGTCASLDHFIQDILVPFYPGFDQEVFQSVTGKPKIAIATADRLCEISGSLCQEPLFISQKRLIERHFLTNWSTQTTIYLFLDDASDEYMDQHRMKYYRRYLHFPDLELTFNDGNDKDPSTEICLSLHVDLIPYENGNLESEKATFFLHGPILEVSDVDYYHEEYGFDPQTVSNFASAVHFAWDFGAESRTSVDIRGPKQGKDQTSFIRGKDWFLHNSTRHSVELKGLEVLEDGKRIRFRWRELVDDLVEMFGDHDVIAQMWTNKRVLSPIWGELPIELVQKIFNSLIESYISGCFFDDKCTFDDDGHLVEISPNWASIGTARSLQAWELRHQTLFRRQRHLIERHFQDEWLSRMTLYLCLDAEFDTPFLRYFHFPESEDCIHTKVRVKPDKKATFFLYRPELSGFVTEGDITLEEMMEDLVNAWDDYRGQRTTSYLIVGIRSKSLQREERYWNRLMDMYNTPKGAVNLEGLEVSEDGRQIRFNWEDFITAMVTWQLHESMRADLAGEL
ncbi:hypothetical protein SMACR_04527 [Sordaria macrospora]|uniref:WGS project CABT00000000 data, contig 2.20 n=2 Tax=Sordaria macrospora TaxID=5147 RepID=F7W1Q3_SORMK|nr:uncharacterized protein SMAC_04527 [Sordaria macrospora k-hell]KAA8630753.1 hypothetical protein SMACR_04527 [Sordaria macrospora]WPJ62746.1 hypothetical protein SMAC4_04527 [Sordaria macrospora]CCC11538.1 unnamed protein product [Sordaria macrospora k-hell]